MQCPWAGGVTGSATPLQGEGCGFESRAVHTDMSSFGTPADVAQLAEARRSERRQCGFDSRRQYSAPHTTGRGATGSAPASETGGWEFESLRPDQRNTNKPCEMVEPAPHLALNQELQVRTLVSQPLDASAVVVLLETSMSACCAGRGSFFSRHGLRVRVPSSFGT